jgi:hypothetical protein
VCVEIFKEKGHQADVKNGLTVAQLHSIIGDYDGMVVRSATKVQSSSTYVHLAISCALFVYALQDKRNAASVCFCVPLM